MLWFNQKIWNHVRERGFALDILHIFGISALQIQSNLSLESVSGLNAKQELTYNRRSKM